MTLLERRRRNPDNLMGLIVHRGKGHTSWSDDLTALTVQFIHSAAARLPQDDPQNKSLVRCRPLRAQEGWLADADLKSPSALQRVQGEQIPGLLVPR